MQKFNTFIRAALAALALSFLVTACTDDTAENAGEEIDQTMEEAGEAIDETVDDAGNAIEDACEKVKEGANADDTDC